jgi:hypothetical protein
MKKLNENITRLKTLMNISEASDVYSNVDFKDRVVGSSTPSKDNINVALLKDVQTAAERANVKVDVTTAVSGHKTGKSRHTTGNAVDIAIINGKAVSNSNRGDADKLVGELIKMGYTKNRESGNPKAVLTFGFPGHDNHVHVSNTTGTPTEKQDTPISEPLSPSKDFATSQSGSTPTDDIERNFIKSIGASFGLKEEKIYSEFGKDKVLSSGTIKLPKNSNSQIKSPVDGIVNNKKDSSTSCVNKIVIQHLIKEKKYYLEFCNITKPYVSDGEKVRKGKIIGETNDDVIISLYNSTYDKVSITKYLNVDTDDDKDKDDDKEKEYKKSKTYKDPLMAALIQAPFKLLNPFKDKYDKKTGERIEKRWARATDKEQPTPNWLTKMSPTYKEKEVDKEDEKINENIERIKKLLK